MVVTVVGVIVVEVDGALEDVMGGGGMTDCDVLV